MTFPHNNSPHFCLVFVFAMVVGTGTFFVNPAGAEEKKFRGITMGTEWNVTVMAEAGLDADAALQDKIQAVLDAVDARMSTWKPDSELSRINATQDISEDIPLSPELAGVLMAALDVSSKTDGAYDITVGPLVNLWKFGPGGRDEPFVQPTKEQILAAKESVGWQALEILTPEEGRFLLRRKKPGLYIDLSSIAKGYGVDQVTETLLAEGFSRFMVEVGGEVRVGGRKAAGRPWKIGIENPLAPDGRLYGSAELENTAMASSGGYRNFQKLENGRIASHIIDPRTGMPVEHRLKLVGVSVLHESCMVADAWATALSVLRPDEAEASIVAQKLRVLLLSEKNREVQGVIADFPLTPHVGVVETIFPDVKRVERKWLPTLLVTIGIFLFFFVAVGLNHLLGRRKMMCACKTARAMEAERQQLITKILPIEQADHSEQD